MRIGLVLDHFDPLRGGLEQWTHQFARRLTGAGHEIHLVARSFGESAHQMKARIHQLPPTRKRTENADAAAEVLKKLSLDVIHDMGVGWYCDVFQPHGGSRIASGEHNLLSRPAWQRPLKRYFNRLSPRHRDFRRLLARQYETDGKYIIALSRMVSGHMEKYHRVSPARLRLIYNGVNVERFTPDNSEKYREATRSRLGLKNETLLLIVAHNFRLKGVSTLLRALSRLMEQGHAVHLAIAGGKHIAPYRLLAHQLGVDRAVTFLGPVADPVPYYAAADVYVQPTFYDPCSLVVLEALSSGLPVVTSRYNGAGELMSPGREGYLISDPSNAPSLAEALEPLMESRRRETMSQAARQLALQHTFNHNIREILAVYDEVLQAKRGTAAA
ncbi:MAG: glycosyltransferase family 4 protein [Planctomycetales bacterium]